MRSILESSDNKYLRKFEHILNRNVGFDSLMQIKDILYGYVVRDVLWNEYVTALSSKEIALFKCSVVTSVDVERFFLNAYIIKLMHIFDKFSKIPAYFKLF